MSFSNQAVSVFKASRCLPWLMRGQQAWQSAVGTGSTAKIIHSLRSHFLSSHWENSTPWRRLPFPSETLRDLKFYCHKIKLSRSLTPLCFYFIPSGRRAASKAILKTLDCRKDAPDQKEVGRGVRVGAGCFIFFVKY